MLYLKEMNLEDAKVQWEFFQTCPDENGVENLYMNMSFEDFCKNGIPKRIEFSKSLGVKTMIAQCDGDNIGSWRVMEKVGMKKSSDVGIRYNKSDPNLAKTEFMYIIDL